MFTPMKYYVKKAGKLPGMLLVSLFLVTTVAEAATVPDVVTQQVNVANSEAIQYKNQYPGVIVDANGYAYDTEIKITLDGTQFNLATDDGRPAYPILVEERTFLPLRAVAELLGASVDYDSNNEMIIIALTDGTTLETYNGSNVIIKNGSTIENISDGLRVFFKEDRAYMPARTVVEAVGFGVNWDGASRTVQITTPGTTTQRPAWANEYWQPGDPEGYTRDRQGGVLRDAQGYSLEGYDSNGYNREGKHWTEVKAEGKTEQEKAEAKERLENFRVTP